MAQLDLEALSLGTVNGNASEREAIVIEVNMVSCSSRFRGQARY